MLERIKKDERFLRIPVVVLTTSNASADVLASYDLHANCFINKPVDFDNFFQIINYIQQFWLETATLPGSVS
nr:response regulator [Lewinella cohaerens]